MKSYIDHSYLQYYADMRINTLCIEVRLTLYTGMS